MAKANITNAGLLLLTNAQGGNDTITFTRMAIGDGKIGNSPVETLTTLVSQKAEMPITQKKIVKTGTYQIGAYFSNKDITTGFYWRETGVFAKGNDGKEILYCYTNIGDATDYISVAADKRIEKYIYQSLSVGNATNITINVNESEMLLSEADKGVAGGVAPLDENGKVPSEHLPNLEINDQTPTYTESLSLVNLTSGEKMSLAFGKIKKAITDLIVHLSDTTRHITSAERSNWNSKANGSHTHTANDVGALSNEGGTVTGDVEVIKPTSPTVFLKTNKSFSRIMKNASDTVEGGLLLTDYADISNTKEFVHLNFSHAKSLNSPNELLQVLIGKNGTGNYKSIFGEHNKPTGTYIGSYNNNRTVNIGGIGDALLVYCTTDNGCEMMIATPKGSFMFNYYGNHALLAGNTFSNGKLILNDADLYRFNQSGITYYYQVL